MYVCKCLCMRVCVRARVSARVCVYVCMYVCMLRVDNTFYRHVSEVFNFYHFFPLHRLPK